MIRFTDRYLKDKSKSDLSASSNKLNMSDLYYGAEASNTPGTWFCHSWNLPFADGDNSIMTFTEIPVKLIVLHVFV